MFNSRFEYKADVTLPEYSGTRVMMMPLAIGVLDSIPSFLDHYKDSLVGLFNLAKEHKNKVGYLTVDEKQLSPGQTHRRAGLHVDGVYRDGNGGWGGGGWGSISTGMLTVSSHEGCEAYNQDFEGWPGEEGSCEHLRQELGEGHVFKAGGVYWVHGLCVHESLPMKASVKRQFVRLSLPSDSPWFIGYTENPLGVKPTGKILPQREFLAA